MNIISSRNSAQNLSINSSTYKPLYREPTHTKWVRVWVIAKGVFDLIRDAFNACGALQPTMRVLVTLVTLYSPMSVKATTVTTGIIVNL